MSRARLEPPPARARPRRAAERRGSSTTMPASDGGSEETNLADPTGQAPRDPQGERPASEQCPRCHSPRLPHRVCPVCGTYAGREVIDHEIAEADSDRGGGGEDVAGGRRGGHRVTVVALDGRGAERGARRSSPGPARRRLTGSGSASSATPSSAPLGEVDGVELVAARTRSPTTTNPVAAVRSRARRLGRAGGAPTSPRVAPTRSRAPARPGRR